MSNLNTGRTLRRLREAAGLRVSDVGEKLSRQGKTVNAWENGRGEPDIDALITLSVMFKCKNILGEIALDRYGDASPLRPDVTAHEQSLILRYRGLDRFGKLATERVVQTEEERVKLATAENMGFLSVPVSKHPFYPGNGIREESLYETTEFVRVSDNLINRDADFAVRVDGKGYEPRFADGEVLLVHRTDELQIGDIGLVAIDGLVYIRGAGHNRLISVSPGVDDLMIDGSHNIRYIGRIIAKA